MTSSPDARQWHIGLAGYGEVGCTLAEDLRAAGMIVSAFDRLMQAPSGEALQRHAAAIGVRLASSHSDLVASADLVISAVTADQTLAVAHACRSGLRAGTFFLDFNSASPGTKIEAAGLVNGAGGRYVEGAVMTSIGPYRIRMPLLLGGPSAARLHPYLETLGFQAKVGSTTLGVVSATKMCRSVLIKGLEAMVIECFCAARAHGVEDAVLASLAETFPGIDWEQQGSYFFHRVIQHGRRRAEEMHEVARTVSEIGLEPMSASSTAKRQAWVADLAARGLFGGGDAPLGDWRIEADHILGATV
ncbi:DUF1932 domain-containing protein [Cupriavidus sp. 8B]